MNKMIRLFALLMAALLVLTGCSMIVIDEDMDNAEVVAEFNGGTITKGEARAQYETMVNYYSMYGYDVSSMDDETITSLKEDLLQSLAKEAIIELKAEEKGFTTMTEEETAELEAHVEEEYNSTVETYAAYFEGEDEEDSKAQAIEYLTAQGYTLESAKESEIDERWQDLLYEDVTKDIEATDEQKEEAYQNMVSEDESTYSSSPASFESAMTGSTVVAWMPEGYRTVKHILIKLSDEDQEALSALSTELSTVESEITDLEASIAAAAEAETEEATEETTEEEAVESDAEVPLTEGEEIVEETAEEATEEVVEESDEEKLAAKQQRKAELESEIAAKQAEYTEKLMPKAQEALDMLATGAEFEDVMAQYGEDPGMQNEPTMSRGYYVSAASTTWEQIFTDTAMALENIGDVSEPVLGSSGLHIIKYMSDVVSGAVDNEEVREEAAATALEDAKDDAYDAAVEQWVTDANVKTYVKKFD